MWYTFPAQYNPIWAGKVIFSIKAEFQHCITNYFSLAQITQRVGLREKNLWYTEELIYCRVDDEKIIITFMNSGGTFRQTEHGQEKVALFQEQLLSWGNMGRVQSPCQLLFEENKSVFSQHFIISRTTQQQLKFGWAVRGSLVPHSFFGSCLKLGLLTLPTVFFLVHVIPTCDTLTTHH